MPIEIPIRCLDCNARASVSRVTAGLMCRCGSNNLDVDDLDEDMHSGKGVNSTETGTAGGKWTTTDTVSGRTPPKVVDYPKAPPPKESSVHTAYPHGYGTGWNKPMPDPAANWAVQPPHSPGPNPIKTPQVGDSNVCTQCHGSGYDLLDKGECRMCQGTGHHFPPTGPPAQAMWDAVNPPYQPGSARWASTHAKRTISGTPPSRAPAAPQTPAPAVQRSSPSPRPVRQPPAPQGGSQGEARTAVTQPGKMALPLTMAARCPACTAPTTRLEAGAHDHAWWACKCGSLADLDAVPSLDPFTPPTAFVPDRGMKRAAKLRRNAHTGRIGTYLATITEHNQLSTREALTIARNTRARYGVR